MVKSVYKTGSCLVLPNPNDQDFIYYCETKEERVEMLTKNHDHSVDNHYRLWGSEPKIFLGCYIYPYMELVEGEEIKEFKEFNILEHKEEYKRTAMSYINYLKDTDKQWYHIYIACKMFERNKITLTKEIKTVAKKIHDNGISEDLKSYCIDVLTSIQ